MKRLHLIFLAIIFDITFSNEADYSRWATAMKEHGFGWEAVTVETEDSYLLTMFNIKSSASFKNRHPPVLIMHGLFMDAAQWLQRQSKDGGDLPWMLQLADQGYDVWMGNSRGTEYSMKHLDFDAKVDDEY